MANQEHITSRDVVETPPSQLHFDKMNPRLIEAGSPETQLEILRVLWREFSVNEIALSIAANGFFRHEPLFVCRENGQFVVVEGNRRLAAVKLLLDQKLREQVGATDLPTIKSSVKDDLKTLPVVTCKRQEIWQYVGFKHVNGPQQWRSYSKAEYIAWVHNELGVSLEEIANRIGDEHSTVARLYGALMVLEQAEKSGVFNRDDRFRRHFSFSHLYTGLDYPGIQRFLGLTKDRTSRKSPVAASRRRNLSDLCFWLYGSKSKEKKPVVETQNPDLRILDEVLQSSNGVSALRSGLPLGIARDISKGDEKLFREALVSAKQALQQARGKLLTGYLGEPDLLLTVNEIVSLATNIHTEMSAKEATKPAKRRAT